MFQLLGEKVLSPKGKSFSYWVYFTFHVVKYTSLDVKCTFHAVKYMSHVVKHKIDLGERTITPKSKNKYS